MLIIKKRVILDKLIKYFIIDEKYITGKETEYMLMKYCISSISSIYIEVKKELNIQYLNVKEGHRGKGYGSFLVLYQIKELLKEKEIEEIKLYDISKRFGEKENIYIKLGFNYIENKKMLGIPKEILKRIPEYKKKNKRTEFYKLL